MPPPPNLVCWSVFSVAQEPPAALGLAQHLQQVGGGSPSDVELLARGPGETRSPTPAGPGQVEPGAALAANRAPPSLAALVGIASPPPTGDAVSTPPSFLPASVCLVLLKCHVHAVSSYRILSPFSTRARLPPCQQPQPRPELLCVSRTGYSHHVPRERRRPGLVRRTHVRPVLLPFHRLTQCQARAGWGQRPGSCRERPAQPSRSQLRVQKLRPLGPAAGARLVPRMLRLHIRLGPKCLTFQYLGFQSRSGPGSCYLFNAQAP